MLTDFKTVHPGCCPPHDNPPWEPPQVIPAQIRRVNNLIFRKINAFSRANGLEQGTPMHGWIVEYLYSHQQLMERKGYIERQSVPQDARLKMLVLTAKGLEFHEKTMLSLHQTDEFVAGLLTEEENTELLRLLNKLKNGLNDSQI